tara:strand:+ start:324 stop:488 length:165 start_codon:yes stop_codon:yes gene_type:complete
MRVGDLALWKPTGSDDGLLVLIVKDVAGLKHHYYCQVIEDGITYVLTTNVLEAV